MTFVRCAVAFFNGMVFAAAAVSAVFIRRLDWATAFGGIDVVRLDLIGPRADEAGLDNVGMEGDDLAAPALLGTVSLAPADATFVFITLPPTGLIRSGRPAVARAAAFPLALSFRDSLAFTGVGSAATFAFLTVDMPMLALAMASSSQYFSLVLVST